MKVTSFFKRFMVEEDGPTAVEYAIMLALILGVIFASVGLVGFETGEMYTDVSTQVEAVMPPTP